MSQTISLKDLTNISEAFNKHFYKKFLIWNEWNELMNGLISFHQHKANLIEVKRTPRKEFLIHVLRYVSSRQKTANRIF